MLFKLGAFAESADLYALGLRLAPADAQGYFALGNAQVKCGKLEKAIHAWEKALELDPSLNSVSHNLAVARRALARAA